MANENEFTISAILNDLLSQPAQKMREQLEFLASQIDGLRTKSGAADIALGQLKKGLVLTDNSLVRSLQEVVIEQKILVETQKQEAVALELLKERAKDETGASLAGIEAQIAGYEKLQAQRTKALLTLQQEQTFRERNLALSQNTAGAKGEESIQERYIARAALIKQTQDEIAVEQERAKAEQSADAEAISLEEKRVARIKEIEADELAAYIKLDEKVTAIVADRAEKAKVAAEKEAQDVKNATEAEIAAYLKLDEKAIAQAQERVEKIKRIEEEELEAYAKVQNKILDAQQKAEADKIAAEDAAEKKSEALFKKRTDKYLAQLRKETDAELAELEKRDEAEQITFAKLGTAAQTAFSKIGAGLQQIDSALNSALGGRFASIFLAFAAVQGVKTGVEDAEKLELSNQALKVSLEGNAELYEKINAQAESISKHSLNTKTEIRELAKTLVEAGVPLDKLQKTLAASVDLSAALGTDLQSTGRQLAATYGGIIPRELSRPVPALRAFGNNRPGQNPSLKQLEQQESLSEGAAVDLIAARFSGTAQKQIDGTAAGQIKIQENDIKNSFAELGKAFLPVKAKLLEAVAELIKRFDEFFKSESGKVLLANVAEIGVQLVKLLPTIIEIVVALKALSIGIELFKALQGAIKITQGLTLAANVAFQFLKLSIVEVGSAIFALDFSAVVAVASPILAVAAAIAAISIGVIALTGNLENVGGGLSNLGKNIKGVFSSLKDGSLLLSDIPTIIGGEMEKAYNNIYYYIYTLPKIALSNILAEFLITFQKIEAGSLADAAKSYLNSGSVGQKLTPNSQKALRSVLQGQLQTGDPEFYRQQDLANGDQNGTAISEATNSNIQKNLDRNGIKKQTTDAEDAAAALKAANQAIDERVAKEFEKAHKPLLPSGSDSKPDPAIADRAAIILQIQDELNKIRLNQNEEYLKEADKQELAHAESQYKDKLITYQEFDQKRRALELEADRLDEARAQTLLNGADGKSGAIGRYNAGQKDPKYKGSEQEIEDLQKIIQYTLELQKLHQQDTAIREKQNDRTKIDLDRLAKEKESVIAGLERRELEAEINEKLLNENRLKELAVKHEKELVDAKFRGYDADELALLKKVQALEVTKLQLEVEERRRQLVLEQNKRNDSIKILQNENVGDRVGTKQIQIKEQYDADLEKYKEYLDKKLITQQQYNEAAAAINEKRRQDEAALTGSFSDGVKDGLKKYVEAIQTESEFASSVTTSVLDKTKSGFGSAFEDIVKGTKSVGQAFRELAASILSDIGRLFAEREFTNIVGSLFGSQTTGGGFKSGGGLLSGILGLFNDGGIIGGRDINRDSVLIGATKGEGVLTRDAVDFYGQDFVHQANALMIPRGASIRDSGRPSTTTYSEIKASAPDTTSNTSTSTSQTGVGLAVVSANNQTVSRLLNGGKNASVQFFSENASEIRSALGI